MRRCTIDSCDPRHRRGARTRPATDSLDAMTGQSARQSTAATRCSAVRPARPLVWTTGRLHGGSCETCDAVSSTARPGSTATAAGTRMTGSAAPSTAAIRSPACERGDRQSVRRQRTSARQRDLRRGARLPGRHAADEDDGVVCTATAAIRSVDGGLSDTCRSDGWSDVSCTIDSCDPVTGVSNVATDSLCDDSGRLHGSETCDAVLDCQAGGRGHVCRPTAAIPSAACERGCRRLATTTDVCTAARPATRCSTARPGRR